MENQIQKYATSNGVSQNSISSKQRFFYIDALRGVAILLVICVHLSFCYKAATSLLSPFVDVFYMPLFMMISGFVVHFETFSIRKRIKILIPFFFFGILSTYFSYAGLVDFLVGKYKHGYWFLWDIVAFSIFLYVIRAIRVNLFKGLIVVEVLLLALYFVLYKTLAESFFSLFSLWHLWPFFSLGVVLKRDSFNWFVKRSQGTFLFSLVIICVSLYIAILFNSFDHYYLEVYWPYDILKMIMAFPICISLLLIFYYAEQKMKGKTSSAKLCLKIMGTMIGTNTLQIYVMHYFILQVLDLSFIGRYMLDHKLAWLEFIVSPVLAIMISYVCIYVAKLIYKMHLGIVFGR